MTVYMSTGFSKSVDFAYLTLENPSEKEILQSRIAAADRFRRKRKRARMRLVLRRGLDHVKGQIKASQNACLQKQSP